MNTTGSTHGQRQTATLDYKISTAWETKTRTTPQKDFWTVNQMGTGHEL